jgi:hypothetical protein
MSDPSADSHAPAAADRLREAVEAANTLLYHAISCGQDLPNTVRDPVIHARGAVARGEMTDEQEAVFLDAYSKLATRVTPVTAATLDATSRRRARRGWLGRLIGLRPVSDAQRLASCFGVLALCLIVAIAATEWTSAFISSILAVEKQFTANSQEMRDASSKIHGLDTQVQMLTGSDTATPESTSTAAVREALKARRDELQARVYVLDGANNALFVAQQQGYRTLERIGLLGQEEIKLVILPLATILGSFLLPVLYGALGTCAFVMRNLFREMVDRTFDGRRTGEFMVRIFLGMLSGLTLQWLVVRSDGTIAGGVTPAVLAFIGGYSVEMLFTAIDRLVLMVTGRSRVSQRSQVAPRPRRAEPAGVGPRRTRVRPAATNGASPSDAPTNGVVPRTA